MAHNVAGVACEVGSTIISCLGKQLMRYGQKTEDQARLDLERAKNLTQLVNQRNSRGNPSSSRSEVALSPCKGSPTDSDAVSTQAPLNSTPCLCRLSSENLNYTSRGREQNSLTTQLLVSSDDLSVADLEHRVEASQKQNRLTQLLAVTLVAVCVPGLDVTGYSLASQSVVAPFSCLDVAWNAMLAPYTLNEQLTTRRLLCVTLLLCGTWLSLIFSPLNHGDKVSGMDAHDHIIYVHDLILSARTMVFVLAVVGFWALTITTMKARQKGDTLRGLALGAFAGSLSGNMWALKIVIGLLTAGAPTGKVQE